MSFLVFHPNDRTISDDLAQWWLEWYKIINNDGCTPKLGECTLFDPYRPPKSNSCEFWIDIVAICHPDCYMLKYFTFELRAGIIRIRKHIVRLIWEILSLLCSSICIITPILTFTLNHIRVRPMCWMVNINILIYVFAFTLNQSSRFSNQNKFRKHGLFVKTTSIIRNNPKDNNIYHITYIDGDEEDITRKVLEKVVSSPCNR